jgi:hypothetical protein
MKKILLLSLLVLFGCSKDSEEKEGSVAQTLIEKLDGKMIAPNSNNNQIETRFWIEKNQPHPMTLLEYTENNGQVTYVKCFKNWYFNQNWTDGDGRNWTREFNILTDDDKAYKSETIWTSDEGNNNCGIAILNQTVELSSSGNIELLNFKYSYSFEYINSTENCSNEYRESSVLYSTIENPQFTPSELCSLSD